MPTKQPTQGKQPQARKLFTLAQANATLPLVKAIVRDIAELARDLRDREERLARIRPPERGALLEAYEEEVRHSRTEIERDQDRMRAYAVELHELGVDLKDPAAGLVDFPSLMDGREVCLCWRQGEPNVDWWHEVDAGYAGRQPVAALAAH